jgi:glycosyltransferase involved in cell wall biosynthesis
VESVERLMAQPKISVIMLTYNRENMVSDMIECVLAGTFSDFEFIIVDNGSLDNSGRIADSYAKKDSRISVIHIPKNINIGTGRNAGLDAAKGDYIAFVDDDDTLKPDYLEYLYKLITENDADFSICSVEGKPFDNLLVMDTEQALEQLFRRKYYNNQFITKLISAKLFENIRFSVTAKYDDIELMTPVLSSAKKVVFGGEPKYIINRHDNNNSMWTQNHHLLEIKTLDEYLNVYRNRTEFLIKKFPSKAALWQYFEWSFMISMIDKIVTYNLADCEERRVDMTRKLQKYRTEFLSCPYIQDFEKEWMDRYVQQKS